MVDSALLLLLLACTGAPPSESASTELAVPVVPAAPAPPFDVPPVVSSGEPCATAWAEFAPFAAALVAQTGKDTPVVDEPAFTAACMQLPEAARPCLSNTYLLANREHCDDLLESVPEGTLDDVYKALAKPAE
jgi:hypothetical protein